MRNTYVVASLMPEYIFGKLSSSGEEWAMLGFCACEAPKIVRIIMAGGNRKNLLQGRGWGLCRRILLVAYKGKLVHVQQVQ